VKTLLWFLLDGLIYLFVFVLIGKLWEYSEAHAGILLSSGILWGMARMHSLDKKKQLESEAKE
jgi:hypothetical protein